MDDRLRYLLRRGARIPRVLASPVGIGAGVATALGIVALLVEGTWSSLLASASLGLWFLTVLMLADRLKILTKRISTVATAAATRTVPSDTALSGEKTMSLKERRLETARNVLTQVVPMQLDDSPDILDAGTSVGPGNPLISVVVPCFNDSRYIVSCLESVRGQTYENWECIVVDDASTDSSVMEAWRFAKADGRFRVVRHTRNSGLSAARNTGLRLARGEFITFLDSDDFLTEDSIEDRVVHMAPHANDPTVAGIFGGVTLAPEDADPEDYRKGSKWSRGARDFVTSGDHCPFNVHAVIVRTSVVEAAEGFDESMPYGAEDWELWYRIMRNGYRFEPSSLTSAIYRQKPSSMRQRHAAEHFAESQRLTHASQLAIDDSITFVSNVAPMLRPKGYYELSARLTRRAIQSAGTALLAGDEDAAVEVLSAVEPVHPLVLEQHVRPDVAIFDGFRRYLGLTTGELAPLRPQLRALAIHAEKLVSVHVQIEEIDVAPSPAEFDVLFLPQTGAQLARMLTAAAHTGLRVGIVDSSSVAGDQGVADRLDGQAPDGITVISYNQAVLRSITARLVVLSYPWDGALDELSAHFLDGGASVVSLESEMEDTLRIDAAPSSRVSAEQITATHLKQALSSNDISSLLEGRRGQLSGDSNDVEDRRIDAADAWTIEEYPEFGFDAPELSHFKGVHAGERVVIIGNGPSLNELDLSLLEGTSTIGVNGIFYADDQFAEPLTYYVVEDTAVIRDNLERIKQYEAGHRFFPSIYRDMIGESPNTTFFMMNRGFYADTSPAFCIPRFSTNPAQRLYAGQSVTIMNLQLAYFMGFEEVILIGMDFSYTVPEDAQVRGALITSMGDDPNHFHPDYFGKGKVWKDPKLDRVLANYALAKQMFEADGRRIVNATPGGNLNLFERVPFSELFGS